MNVEEIKRILSDQSHDMGEVLGRRKVIERDLPEGLLERALGQPNILAILGVRRCGKSTVSHLLLRGRRYGYVNFDDERLMDVRTGDLNRILQAIYELHPGDLDYLVLDEIQNVPGWELFVSRLRQTQRIVLTGSNAKLLSGELATRLTGRYLAFTLHPFSFGEFLRFRDRTPDLTSTRGIAAAKSELQEYLRSGGFPEALIFGKEMVARLYEDILRKDILSRNDVRNRSSLLEVARYLTSNFSHEFTYQRLCEVSSTKNVHTVKQYVGYLTSSYLLLTLERFSYKLKERMRAPRKVYCVDPGIIQAVSSRSSPDMGGLMENVVANDLTRRSSFSGGAELCYWKDHRQREVDFVRKRGESVAELIQVSYASSEEEVARREIEALDEASGELRCGTKLVITWDYEGEAGGVPCLPLWKWLLGPDASRVM